MKRLKVVTIVGTRPEIIRLSRVIALLDATTDHTLVHTGQNDHPNLNEVFFQDLQIRQPDKYLQVDTSSLGTVLGETISKSEKVLIAERPDAVVILGDTNSAVSALVAERLGVPVYHLEAGNRSFDSNVPEELNRRMVDHVATFNLPYNSYSKQNLLDEGIHPRFIFVTGSPLMEVHSFYSEGVSYSRILSQLGLEKRGYILASVHRQENVDNADRLRKVLGQLSSCGRHFGVDIVLSTHPRTRKMLENQDLDAFDNVKFEDPFGYFDYNRLQSDSLCVVSDSGTIFEESTISGFKAVCLRDSTERVEALGVSSVLMSPVDSDRLVETMQRVLSSSNPASLPEGYEVTNFSERVVNIICSTAPLYKKWKNLF